MPHPPQETPVAGAAPPLSKPRANLVPPSKFSFRELSPATGKFSLKKINSRLASPCSRRYLSRRRNFSPCPKKKLDKSLRWVKYPAYGIILVVFEHGELF